MARRNRKKRLSMRKIREVLRLGLVGRVGTREIARSCNVAPSTVIDYLRRARASGLEAPLPADMDDRALEELLFPERKDSRGGRRPQPDCAWIHQELRKKSVTLQLLWEEYKEQHPDGYQITQFYELYRRFKKKLDVTLRQSYKAGEKMFVDYAGQTIPIIDRQTGEIREAELFLAALGASNATFAEASWDQSVPSWIESHIHAFEFFGGVAEICVPDNLKSGVTKPCRYEPDINLSYNEMAIHYGTVIIPARPVKPRDKAKVEAAVLLAERWILAALRNRKFFSLEELNREIRKLLHKLNHRPFKKLDGSRWSWYEKVDRPALLPLPRMPYELADWKKAKVNIDYHIELERHYYSVPYSLVREQVEIRFNDRTVEIFFKRNRVATHARSFVQGGHTTLREHMPKSHQKYLEWTPSRLIAWAKKTGESTANVVEKILETRRHPEQGYRSCLGILQLGKRYDEPRLEAACRRALAIKTLSYKSIKSILENGLDRTPLETVSSVQPMTHGNIRGNGYYR